jgi:FMNH2-dependent dimethyl sulfone monooxygenase
MRFAATIAEFEEAGVDLLLLKCSPQLEEMDRFATEVVRQTQRVGNSD